MKRLLTTFTSMIVGSSSLQTVENINSNLKNYKINKADKLSPIYKYIGYKSQLLQADSDEDLIEKKEIYEYDYITKIEVEQFLYKYEWANIKYSFYGGSPFAGGRFINHKNETKRIQISRLTNIDEVTLWFYRGDVPNYKIWYGSFLDVSKNWNGLNFYFKVYIKSDLYSFFPLPNPKVEAQLQIESITFEPS